jgi:hypothetical protein
MTLAACNVASGSILSWHSAAVATVGQAVMSITHSANTLAPWAGFAVFCGYAPAALAIGAVVLARRDA